MKYILIVLVGFVLLFFSIWAHHMIMAGVNPFISNFLVIPLLILFLVGLVYLKKKIVDQSSNSVSALFGIAFLLFLFLSALSYFFWGNSAIDLQLHDTYFVIAHFHLLILFSLPFGLYAVIYFVSPKLIKRKLNETLGKIHFWLTALGIFLFIYPINHVGMAGVPRRYYNVEELAIYNQFGNMNLVLTIIVALLIFPQVIFIANFAYSFFKTPKK